MCEIEYKEHKKIPPTGREERSHTDIAERIVEELNSKTAFVIPVFGGIPVGESVVVTWIIMAVLVIGSMVLVLGLKV